jgi:DNA helicase-2/ATP-dependent DNA helicase PcrA
MTKPGSDQLTPSQHRAVEHEDGPLLVLAGPGSGKTRVITRRIARLVERGVEPREILAITFTNKAASEMGARVAALLPGSRVWVSTFHRFCARLLRARAAALGMQPNFTIFDTQDQRQLLRRVLKDLNIDSVHYPPARLAALISNAKNDLLTAELYERKFSQSVGNHTEAVVARVYPAYQEWLLKSNAVDFDDLLLHVVTLLTENPELRAELDERYRYVLVDEYQDTNLAQYRIVAALSHDYPNLCVTGDPDQSIYGWRGAKIDNILRFEAEFPKAVVVRLEENFRSTQRILETADNLIAHNVYRKHKALLTDNEPGEAVRLLTFRDGLQEADLLAREIRQLVDEGRHKWSDVAVMYRVNALSREVERALGRQRIPFQVAAGVAFYERAEIKDMLAYLRLLYNPADQEAFLRVVNVPPRGIGKTSCDRLVAWAAAGGFDLMEAARRAREHPQLSKRAAKSLQEFAGLLEGLAAASEGGVANLLALVLERTAYLDQWRGRYAEHDQQNVVKLV